jgi:hypothetical protein
VTPDGVLWTTLTTTAPGMKFSFDKIALDRSTDGGATWTQVSTVADNIPAPPGRLPNTTFRDGILDTFATGPQLVNGSYPLYVAWEDFGAGVVNVLLRASYDGGLTWTAPIQVNDNASPVDEFQPNLSVAANGHVTVNFYDRRLACPAQGTTEAVAAGLALDTNNPNSPGVVPYGATDYCVDASIQFYNAQLAPSGHNLRLSRHSFDPQLNAPHTGSVNGVTTFIGDYFGNTSSGGTSYSTFVSTYDDGSNPAHYQQQVVASLAIP